MLSLLSAQTPVQLEFTKRNIESLEDYFDINFPMSDLEEKKIFFYNLATLCKQSLGLAHCIQHDITARVAVQLSQCSTAKNKVLSQRLGNLVGCYSIVKRSDALTLNNFTLNGSKKWFSNLELADYAILQVAVDKKPTLVYIDLTSSPHQKSFDFFSPIGMEIARAGELVFDNLQIDEESILGIAGTQQFFPQSNFASYCFLTNHLGITEALFKDIKQYANKFSCGAEFELKKLEMDVCTMRLMWENNLSTLGELELSHEFWNRRNTQYAFSKKTLIRLLQLILELGVTYYTDAHSEFSQRFRDALTYSSHMHPLYKFGQEFYMIDLDK